MVTMAVSNEDYASFQYILVKLQSKVVRELGKWSLPAVKHYQYILYID